MAKATMGKTLHRKFGKNATKEIIGIMREEGMKPSSAMQKAIEEEMVKQLEKWLGQFAKEARITHGVWIG